MASLTVTIPVNIKAEFADRTHANNGTEISDDVTTRLDYRLLSSLGFTGIDPDFESVFPEIHASRLKEDVSVYHFGQLTTVQAYTGNIYFAIVPKVQVVGIPLDLWPSPTALASDYQLADPSADVTRVPVSDRGLVGWLMEGTWPATPITVTAEAATISNIPISRANEGGVLFEGEYCILLQQVNSDGTPDSIKLIVEEDAGGTGIDADTFIGSNAYPSGIYPFNANGTYLTETDAADLALKDLWQLKGRIRTIPLPTLFDGWKARAGTDAPIAKIFAISEDAPTSVEFTLAGWYFDAVDVNGDPIANVPQGIKALVTVQVWNDPTWDNTATTVTIDSTNPNLAKNLILSGLTAGNIYRLKVDTASKGNTLDGDGTDTFDFHREAADGAGYTDTNLESAKANLVQGSAVVVSEVGAVPLDTPQFVLLERFNPNKISYTITNNATDSSLFDIAFVSTSLTEVTTLDIVSGLNVAQETGDASPSYTTTFTGLTEAEIESTWTFTATYSSWTIEFDYTIGTNSIGSLVETADGVFTQEDNVVPTEMHLLNSSPDVYKTRTLNVLGTVSMKKIRYGQTSSKLITFAAPEGKVIDAVTIETEEFSPFGPGFIQYYIVADGLEYEITPVNQDGDAPEFYHFNSALSAAERLLSVGQGFIDTDTTGKVSIKVILTRPEDTPFTTPMVTRMRCNQIRSDQ